MWLPSRKCLHPKPPCPVVSHMSVPPPIPPIFPNIRCWSRNVPIKVTTLPRKWRRPFALSEVFGTEIFFSSVPLPLSWCPDAQCALTLAQCFLLCPHSPGSVAHLFQPPKQEFLSFDQSAAQCLLCPVPQHQVTWLVHYFLQNISLHRILLFYHKIKPFKSQIRPPYSEPSQCLLILLGL